MKKILFALFFLNGTISFAQPIREKLAHAVRLLLNDSQFKHAAIGFCVADSKTGNIIYEYNGQTGLAAASTQKLFTSCAAFDLLGRDYRYRTVLGCDGSIEAGVLKGNLHIIGSGDPSFGSWRWNETKENVILKKMITALKQSGIQKITGDVYINNSAFSGQPIPGGWVWEDIGNYYGAGCWGINWHENQYDLLIRPGKKAGDPTILTGTRPELADARLVNGITTGERGSGDNACIYLPPYAVQGFTEGTVPPGDSLFVISGSFPNAPQQFGHEFQLALAKEKIEVGGAFRTSNGKTEEKPQRQKMQEELVSFFSPPLDSLNYWFLKKSINLYGEALLKTIALEKSGAGITVKGVDLVKDFWSANGIDKSAINILDGSGLSPQNRVTAAAEVQVLQYARSRPWFRSFYEALPEYNGMKMKSGSIGGVRALAGYQTAANGKVYTFSIIINNYDGPPAGVIKKMYRVLDNMK
jgi:D-alanyl-D-alanine carboxypeptidase/D-alanyl-D-alanine-endopeptidase (penicillin-binding protein 4)